jgi:hypothetical protein
MADRGAWIVPLIVPFDGPLFTEQQIPAGSFDPATALESIRVETGQTVAIQNAANSASGELRFDYRGPRAILVIVVAEPSDLGRVVVAALWESAAQQGFRQTERAWPGGSIAVLAPIEVYPGFHPPLDWKSMEAVEGTATLRADLSPATLRVTCPAGQSGEERYDIYAAPVRARGSGCSPLRMAMPFHFRLQPPDGAPGLGGAVEGFEWSIDPKPHLSVDLACAGLASSRIDATLIALPDYRAAADRFAGGEDAANAIWAISTVDPGLEPHRVYGLASALELFFVEVAGDQRRIPLSSIRFETETVR